VASGGARARSGPAPEAGALRRDRPSDQAGWTHLPAPGRAGDPPPWPLARQKAFEKVRWAAEWTRPQALMWEARGQALEVALYVRAAVIAEGSKALASDRALVLRFMDDLGISSGGLAKNRWVIDRDIDDQPEVERPVPARGGSAKERLKLVVNT